TGGATNVMDRVLFGDNQFFGVNHMSEEKARAQAMRFQDLPAVLEVLDTAYQEGIRTFMCTTHDRVAEICDHFRANAAKYPDNPIVCANINKIGFRMCGGIALYEQTIATRRFRPVAMSVLASGAIAPREAIEYVCRQPKIESIVFGASSRGNIRQTKTLIDELTVTA